MPDPIRCPHDDGFKTNGQDTLPAQVGQFLEHFADEHAQSVPPPLRETLKACAKELQQLPLPTK